MILTIPQCASVAEREGCPSSRVVEWVAIPMAESSLNTTAVSPAGAIGLYQIMPFNGPPNGCSVAQLYDAYCNAHVAMRMSGGGTSCAAWDTCYANIAASGRYSFLGFPERGSAAYNNLAQVASVLGRNPPVPPPGGGHPSPGQPPSLPQLAAAFDAAGTVLTTWSDDYLKSMILLESRAHNLGGQFHPSLVNPLGG